MTRKVKKVISIVLLLFFAPLFLACSDTEKEPTTYEEVNTLRGVRLSLDKEIDRKSVV